MAAPTTGLVAATIFADSIDIDWDGDTWKCALYDSDWEPTLTSALGYSSTDEIVATGYTAGGATLTGVTITRNASRFRMVANDVSWSSSTFSDVAYAAVYSATATAPVADPIVAIFVLPSIGENGGGDFTVAFPDSPAAGTVIDIPAV